MRLELTTPPAAEPLTASEVKVRLGIGSELSDATVESLITTARQTLDGYTGALNGRALITQTWTMYLPCFGRCIRIPLRPLRSIASVKYIDADGVEQTVASGDYQVINGLHSWIEPTEGKSWPGHRRQGDAVRVVFIAGYGAAGSDVPEPIRAAITLKVSHLRSMMAQNLFLSEDSVEGVGSQRFVVGGGAGEAIEATIDALISGYVVRSV